jgi:hypothetical protein
MLKRAPGLVLGMAGQVHLPVLANDPPAAVDQDRAVEAPALGRQLGMAQIEPDAELGRGLEQRPGRPAGHLGLEEGVDLGLRAEEPAREEGRERQLREDDEIGAAALGLAQERDEPRHRPLPALAAGDRAELGGGDGEVAGHAWVFLR